MQNVAVISFLFYSFCFPLGRRVCLGENMAKIQLFIFFTHLLHRFTFIYPDGSPLLPDVAGAQPIPDFLVTAIPRL